MVPLLLLAALAAASPQTPRNHSAILHPLGHPRLSGAIERTGDGSPPVHLLIRSRQVQPHLASKLRVEMDPEGTDDFFRARAFFISDRRNKSGKLDPRDRERAQAHRDEMPAVQLGVTGRFSPSLAPSASGLWTNVGPSGQLPPQVLFSGPSPVSGRVNAVAFDPTNSNVIYLGAAGGGLWKSTDGGQGWAPLTDAWPYLNVSAIAIDRTNPKTIYVGTGDFQGLMPYSFGIMKSSDGGVTWSNYGKSLFGSNAVSSILIDPDNHNIVTATTGRGYSFNAGNWNDWLHGGSLDGQQGAIYRSQDGGLTWTKTNAPFADWCGVDVSTADASGNRTYWAAGTYPSQAYEGTLWYSTDHGATWFPALNANGNHIAMDVACSKVDHNTVYLLVPDSNPGAYPPYDGANTSSVFRTTDAGLTWSDISAGFPNDAALPSFDGYAYNWSQGFYDFYIRTSTATVNGISRDALYVGLITVAFSPDGGATWYDAGQSYTYDPNTGASYAQIHVDQHAFAVSPSDPNTVLLGNDGGVYEMVFDPVSVSAAFSYLNGTGLITTQPYRIAANPTNVFDLLAGEQDNGTGIYSGNSGGWQTITGGDGGFCAISPQNPLVQYTTVDGLKIAQTTDGWNTGNYISVQSTFPSSESTAFIPPIAVGAQGQLYAATDHLWVYNAATGWTGDLGGQKLSQSSFVRTIAVCPGSNRIYTGSQDGQLWVTPNGGTTWQQINSGIQQLGVGPIVAISPSPSSCIDLVVGLTGYGGSHLWRCTNVSAPNASRIWMDVTGTGSAALPDVPVFAIARDPFSPTTTWYVATDVGVFVTKNAGASWANMSGPAGLPNACVTDLQISGSTLFAATFGRGVWRIQMVNPTSLSVSSVAGPASMVGSAYGSLTVALNKPAPFGGVWVSLKSSSGSLHLPADVLVPFNASSLSEPFSTSAVGANVSATVTASLGGSSAARLILLTPGALAGVSVPVSVVGGNSAIATINLNGTTPIAGVGALSKGSFRGTIPGYVSIAANTNRASFKITPLPVAAPTSETFSVRYLSLQRAASMTILPPSALSLTLNPGSVRGGDASVATLVLDGPAPAGGWTFSLLSTSALAALPPSITVPPGQKMVSFSISTKPVSAQTTISVVATPKTSGTGIAANLQIVP